EYVNGIVTIVRNAGTPSETSLQSIPLTPSIMSAPTRMRAGDVAALGTAPTSGQKNIATTNRPPVVTAVRPDRPPSSTPAADSTYAVVVEVPIAAPKMAARPSIENSVLA